MKKKINPKIAKLIRQIEKQSIKVDEMVPNPVDTSTFWSRLISTIKYKLGLYKI